MLLGAAVLAGDVAMAAGSCDASPETCPSAQLTAGYTGEFWRNASGGIERGSRYLDQVDAAVTVDAERLFGWRGVTAYANLLYNNGRSFSGERTGDAQVVSNIEGPDSLRLYEFWVESRFGAAGAHSLRLGVYDLNSEFDTLESSSLFINSSHGVDVTLGQTGQNGPSIFPVPGAGLRVRTEARWGYAQLAVLDGVPGERSRPDRTGVHFDRQEGALLVLEAGRATGAFSKLALGAWSYTARFDELVALDAAGSPRRTRDNRGFYALAEARLHEAGPRHVDAFLRFGGAQGRFNVFSRYVGAGVVVSGWPSARAHDRIGLAVAHAVTGDSFRQAAVAVGDRADRAETILELTWRLTVSDHLVMQPDIQYIINPGTDPALKDAFALGLRLELTGGWGIGR